MADTRTSNSIKNTGATLFGRMATMLMDFVLRTVMIRFLGIEYGGVSTLFMDILQVLSLVELGLGGAIIYALYKPLAQKDYIKVNALMCFYRKAYNLIAVIILILGIVCVPFLNFIVKDVPDIKEDIRLIFMLYVIASSCSYLVIYKETLIKASQQSRVSVRIEMLVQFVFMAMESLALLIWREYLIYLVLRIVAYLVRNILISSEVKKRFPDVNFKSKEALPSKDRHKLVKDIEAMALYKISGVVLNSSTSVIVSVFLGTSIVGIVGNFRMMSNFVCNLSNNMWVAILPSVGNMAAIENDNKQYAVFLRMKLLSFMYSAICSIAMFILMNPLVSIWLGSEYTVSTMTVFVMAFNIYLFLTILPFQTFRDANGLFVQGKYRPVIMSILNVLISVWMVQRWGMVGALLGTPISRVLTQMWFDPYVVYKYVFKTSSIPYYKELLIHFLLALASGTIVYFVLDKLNICFGVLQLLVGGVLSVTIPLLLYWLFYRKRREFVQLVADGKRLLIQIFKRKG